MENLRVNVVQLPSTNTTSLWVSMMTAGLVFDKYYTNNPANCGYVNIYFVSDRRIFKGDWYLFNMGDSILDYELMQCQDAEEADRCNNHYSIKNSCKLIEATTNKELYPIYGIEDAFLKQFVESKVKVVDLITEKYDGIKTKASGKLKVNSLNQVIVANK